MKCPYSLALLCQSVAICLRIYPPRVSIEKIFINAFFGSHVEYANEVCSIIFSRINHLSLRA
jgi:hypothetical protein